MFDHLTEQLTHIFEGLKRRGALSESHVNDALREVRVALLEADVSLPVVKAFIEGVSEKAVGANLIKSISPAQMVIKIVNDHLVEVLGSETAALEFYTVPPATLLLVGLQGSGKTTTTAKLGKWLTDREKKKVLMASLDTQRPAAQEQLKVLGKDVEVSTLPIVHGQLPKDIARRAMDAGRLQGCDIILLDTAGRMHADEGLMSEMANIRDITEPSEVLLVADALTGQDAINVAEQFNNRIGITGIVLTRMDGDARGGAALSMKAATGCPIKLLGTGESMSALEVFHPDRLASRILGMGDVVGLVERATELVKQEDAANLEEKIRKGSFDLDDLAQQLQQIRRMGGMEGIMGMLPGVGKIKKQMKDAQMDEGLIKRQEAIIKSMTRKERHNAKLLNASRRRRVASGSGTSIQDVNRLLKQFKQMSSMMKKVNKMGKKGLMRNALPNFPMNIS